MTHNSVPDPSLWTDDFLWKKREQMDPLADELVARIIKDHDQKAFHDMYQTLIRNSGVQYEKLPPHIREYFEQAQELPSFADEQLIVQGEDVYEKHGLTMTMLLFYKSLPMAYSCGRGAKVLHATGRLGAGQDLEPFTRRLMETAQFVVNVMTEGGLKAGGEGIITALKVRLIHASIRYYLKEKGWDTPHYGEPINQQDMAGTLMSFSALVLEGLKQMNIDLTEQEEEAYIHAWRVVGHFMGVDHDLIPADAADANKLGHLIFNQQLLPSQEGIDLTSALMQFSHKLMSAKLLAEVPEAMIHYFLGADVSKAIGISPAPDLTEKIVDDMMGTVFNHDDRGKLHHQIMAKLGEHLRMLMLQGSIKHFNEHKRVTFYLPPSLQDRWTS